MRAVADWDPGSRRSGRRAVALAGLGAVVLTALLAIGTPPAGAGPRADRSGVRTIPDEIPSDCSVDVTRSLNGWIAQAPNGETLQLAEDGCYRVEGSVSIQKKRGLTIDGNGATLRANDLSGRDRRHVWIHDSADVVIRDLNVEGPHVNAGPQRGGYDASRAFQHGFALQGVHGMVLDNVSVKNVFGDFVYVGNSFTDGRWSRDVRVTGSTFDGSGRQGISVVAGKRIRIDHNRIGRVGQSLIDLEANNPAYGAIDVRIEKNRTGAARHFWLANKGTGTQIRRIVVKGNTMEEATGALVFVFGPYPGYRGPFTFVDNRFIANNAAHDEGNSGAFFLSRAKDVTIRGNRVTFPVGANMPAVENRDSVDVVVEGNRFKDAGPTLIETGTSKPTSPGTTVPPTTTTTRR